MNPSYFDVQYAAYTGMGTGVLTWVTEAPEAIGYRC